MNDVKYVISLTSWQARIRTAGMTIYSLIRNCNKPKIALTLSLQEFPGKEYDLPHPIIAMSQEGYIDLIWATGPNVKCFKKILFAMAKYPTVPIVSADDDCLYTADYAKVLYETWEKDQKCIYTYRPFTFIKGHVYVHGPATIYPPNCFGAYGLKLLNNRNILGTWHDDVYYSVLAEKLGIKIKGVPNAAPISEIYKFHDVVKPMGKTITCSVKKAKEICEREIRI